MGHTYSITQIVGTSDTGIDDAIRSGIETAAHTLRNLEWFEVDQIRGHIRDGKVDFFQVALRIGFRYERHT